MSFKWRDNSIRIFSVLIAILMWVYVTNEQNPVTDQTFFVPLMAQGTPGGYVVDGLPGTVSVRVRGTRIAINTLQREDFTARADLSGIEPGEQDINVTITSPSEVEVLQVTPALVRVTVDRIEEKNVPVAVVARGTVAPGMQAGEPVSNPPLVAVRGPSAVLDDIRNLPVAVDITGAHETLVRELPLETGLDNVTLNPSRVTVTVPVAELPTGNVPVSLRLTGEPAAGYETGATTVQPQTVRVTAGEEVLQELAAVSTMTLDISGVSGDVEREVILMLPDGARFVEPDRVTVTVRIIPVETEEEQPPPGEEGNAETETENDTNNDTDAGNESGTGSTRATENR